MRTLVWLAFRKEGEDHRADDALDQAVWLNLRSVFAGPFHIGKVESSRIESRC
jgi:hypothetical protein